MAEVVGVARVLVQDVRRDVVVELEEEHVGERVVVVLRGVVVDVRLGGGVVERRADGGPRGVRRHDALELARQLPPARVPLVRRQVLGVEVVLEERHGAGRERDEHGVVERLAQERLDRVWRLDVLGEQADALQEARLERREPHQAADGLVVGAVGAAAQHRRHLGTRVGKVIVDVAQLVVRRLVPVGVGLHRHQRAHVALEVDVPGAGVGVLLVGRVQRQRVERAARVEAPRQRLEAE